MKIKIYMYFNARIRITHIYMYMDTLFNSVRVTTDYTADGLLISVLVCPSNHQN